MTGTKLKTLPTPVKTASMTSEWMASLTPSEVSPSSTQWVMASMPSANRSWKKAPTTSNVSQKIRAMTATKMGSAVKRPVRNSSIFRLRACSLLSWGLTTVWSQSRRIKRKRMSATAAALSSPRSSSICFTMCSIISHSLASSCSSCRTRASPSINLAAAKRSGICAWAA